MKRRARPSGLMLGVQSSRPEDHPLRRHKNQHQQQQQLSATTHHCLHLLKHPTWMVDQHDDNHVVLIDNSAHPERL